MPEPIVMAADEAEADEVLGIKLAVQKVADATPSGGIVILPFASNNRR